MKIDVALVQTKIEWENKEKNIEKLVRTIEKSHNYAELILLAEMSFTGFSMNVRSTWESNETLKLISEIAKENKIAIGFGWVRRNEEKAENHYTIVDSSGSVLNDYIKIHSFSYGGEDKEFLAGNKISTFMLNDFKCSSFICYDLRFPELFRNDNEDDEVEIFLIPANWPKQRREHWITLLKARAIENQAYVLGINCVGNIGGVEYSGDSCIVSPEGTVLQMVTDREGILYASIKKDDLKIRREFPVLKDKKIII